MSALLDFLKEHEEGFRSRARLSSLYSDFRSQKHSNPDGYHANVSTWLRGLTLASAAQLLPGPSTSSSIPSPFTIHTGPPLLRALQTDDFGQPVALGAVVSEGVASGKFFALKEFLDGKASVYARKKGVASTAWEVLGWGLRQLGLDGEGKGKGQEGGEWVVLENVERAARTILAETNKPSPSPLAHIYTRELFTHTFAPLLSLPTLSPPTLTILLTHLSRDHQALTYSSSLNVIKFSSSPNPTPLTPSDASIASLRTLLSTLTLQTTTLSTLIADLTSLIQTQISEKNLPAARISLRKRKAAESTLSLRSATLAQLEDVYAQLERAADNVQLVTVLEGAKDALESMNRQTGGTEKVQTLVDALADQRRDADEISRVLNEGAAEGVDEGEVEAELEGLEREAREREDGVALEKLKELALLGAPEGALSGREKGEEEERGGAGEREEREKLPAA